MPVGVDDSTVALEEGTLQLRWGDGQEMTLQFLDDGSCTLDSDAWVFLIGPNLQPATLYRSGVLCDFHETVAGLDPPPANRGTILAALAQAEDLCG